MTDKHTKLLELRDVSAGYNGDTILRNVNITVHERDFIGVIGPNGGGKTTLVKVMLGLLKPSKGKVVNYLGPDTGSHPAGYLPQINDIDRKFPISVRQVISSGLIKRGSMISRFSKRESKEVRTIMEEMDLVKISRKPIGELSGGQLQRVMLARAIVSRPRLLILDEPNTFVDNAFESELYARLNDLNREMAIIIVTHDVGMISSYVKTIACVNGDLHYHRSNVISEEQLKAYNCPIQLITHGDVPHTVLEKHEHE